MSNIQRETEILAILKEKTFASVDYLAGTIHISASSIRRDLASLEEKGLIRRTHGGAALLSASPGMAPFSFRLQENKRGKLSILRTAAALITPGSSIYVDSSTTALNIYHYITADMNLTVFTNNIQLAHLLAARKIRSYCIGGCVSEHNNVITTGSYALTMLHSIYVDFMFFSSSALSPEGIITDLNEEETAVRRQMLSHSTIKVFLCSQNRYGNHAPFHVIDARFLDYIVSDFSFSPDFCKKYPQVTFLKA